MSPVFRFFARSLGLLTLAAALGAIAIDAARSIAASALTLTELEPAWSALNAGSLAAFREIVEMRIAPVAGAWVVDPLLASVLATPLSVALTDVGFVLILFGAPRRRPAPPEFFHQ